MSDETKPKATAEHHWDNETWERFDDFTEAVRNGAMDNFAAVLSEGRGPYVDEKDNTGRPGSSDEDSQPHEWVAGAVAATGGRLIEVLVSIDYSLRLIAFSLSQNVTPTPRPAPPLRDDD